LSFSFRDKNFTLKKQFGYHYIAAVLLTMALVGCSTQKNTFLNRNYHNLTAHYNVFFNGNEAMKAGLAKVETQLEEDYTKILPVFKESLPGTEKIVSSDMTTAIEKATKLVKFHSITKPPGKKKATRSRKKTEPKADYNNWVDDAYLMMGRAYLYKKEYIMASSTFQLIIRKYKNEPVKYEAYLWYIRSLNESERYTEAQELIQMLESDKQFPVKLEGELAIVSADFHLKQQQFEEAIHSLDIGIKKIKGNKRKSRYTFILAQLYQETGKKEQALAAYHQVIRRRPEYSLLFNAQIKSAEVLSGEGNVSVLRKELNKMRKKKWNEPFLDQIYYALANISFNEGKVDDAIGLFKKSVSVSKNNIHQKALSSLTLGDIYFDRKNYIPSGSYYDTAMVIIDKNYPNFEAISKKYSNLSKLVENLKTVETQDSLQHLASLDKKDLEKLVSGWVDAEKKKIQNAQSSESEGEMTSAYYRSNSSRMRINNAGSSFYFYNNSTVSFGKKEFSKLWGERKNEDDWRRKNKSVTLLDEMGEPIKDSLSVELIEDKSRIDDPTKPEYYTQDIPSNDSLMKSSHMKIRDALFNSGSILKTEFNNFEQSIGCFSSLNKRYPTNIYLLSSYFNLWDLYHTIGNSDSSNYYKELIIKNYPESNFAKYLVNPNFFIEEAARKDSMNKLYTLAFNFFNKRDYSNAIIYSKKVQNFNPDTALISKVQFIRTVSESKDMIPNQFADSLRLYIKHFPKAEPTPLAEKIVSLIKEDKFSNYNQLVTTGYLSDIIKNNEVAPQNLLTNDADSVQKWDTDNELLHYFIIAFPSDNQIDINRLKYDIANYNIDHYTSLDFEIETENLNPQTKMVIVRNFDNKESAMIYFLSIIRKPEVFKALAGKTYLNFITSNNNYRQMLNDQSYKEYIAYFIKNYSSITTGKFSEKDLETPEQLMARMNLDPANDLKEQGEYVLLNTKNVAYTPPTKKEQLFNPDYNLPYNVTIIVKEKNAGTGYLMRDLIRYNSANQKEKRLRVIPGRLKEATLLTISLFPNAYEANEYLKTISNIKELFTSLGDLKYDIYTISDENLKKLIETENMEEWGKFYQTYFVRRTPPALVKPEKKSVEKIGETKKEQESILPKNNIEPPKPENNQNRKPETIEAPQKPSAEKIDTVTVSKKIAAPVNSDNLVTDSVSTTQSQQVKELYTFVPGSGHNLIYMLPAQSSNQSLLNTYLNRFNTMKYRSSGIVVVTEPFDDFRVFVIIKGFKDKDAAAAYYADVKTDQRISMSLRNVNYKSYLISNENLQTLKNTKDIVEYQKFSDKNY
jgi:tetratricopeptide (TPR) repeat protein